MSRGESETSGQRLLSVDQAAHALGVSARFVRMLGVRGQIRIVRLGRRTLVPWEELQRLASDGAPQR
jgi:excisionase family DNA binding protein